MKTKNSQITENCYSPAPGIHILALRISDCLARILPGKIPENYLGKPRIDFAESDFCQRVFSPREIRSINHFKILKKQAEWICGRYTLKRLAQKVLTPENRLEEITVSYLAKGAPFIEALPHVPISISHSGDYTAAAVSTDPDITLGIDIEKIGSLPRPGFMKTAFTQNEIAAMPQTARDVFIHWTLKEAYLKLIKLGFNESLHRVEIINTQVFSHGKPQPVKSVTQILDESYALSLMWNSP